MLAARPLSLTHLSEACYGGTILTGFKAHSQCLVWNHLLPLDDVQHQEYLMGWWENEGSWFCKLSFRTEDTNFSQGIKLQASNIVTEMCVHLQNFELREKQKPLISPYNQLIV